jgi:hypothetical protein
MLSAFRCVSSISSILFAREPNILPDAPDELMTPLRGFTKLWSVAAATQSSRESRHGGDRDTRAVVGQDLRSSGISCFSCNGTTCPHRTVACAILDLTSGQLSALWRSTRVCQHQYDSVQCAVAFSSCMPPLDHMSWSMSSVTLLFTHLHAQLIHCLMCRSHKAPSHRATYPISTPFYIQQKARRPPLMLGQLDCLSIKAEYSDPHSPNSVHKVTLGPVRGESM